MKRERHPARRWHADTGLSLFVDRAGKPILPDNGAAFKPLGSKYWGLPRCPRCTRQYKPILTTQVTCTSCAIELRREAGK